MPQPNGTVKMVGKIYETTDYGMFKPLSQNRGSGNNQGVKKSKVKKIIQLMEAGKFIYELSPIQVNQRNQIIDGHHRLAAMRELGKPVRFIVIENERFNNNSHSQTSKVEFVNNIYNVNGTNPTWTGKDLFYAGIELKLELALGIEKFLLDNENNFDFNDVLALLTRNLNVFKGAKKAGYDVTIFNNKDLLQKFKSPEFQEELDFFIRLNYKLLLSPRRKVALDTFYTLLWNAERLGLDPDRLMKKVISIPEKTIKNNSKMKVPKVAIRTFISDGYNKGMSKLQRVKVSTIFKTLLKTEEAEEAELEELEAVEQ